ncbi:MAG: GNAT family N-acetyltransferase [Thalassotalea sp.]|nr:GNAT family N-acetyltransferase [Thalassotalea sp.]
MIILETKRLILRLLTDSDQNMILQLLNEPAFIENIGDKGVKNLADALNYILTGPLNMQESLGFCLYCCELKNSGELIGLSGLIKREGIEHPEVGFAFLAKHCKKGYGFESASAVVKYAKDVLQIETLQAICNPENIASSSLLTKLGFHFKKQLLHEVSTQKINLFERGNTP